MSPPFRNKKITKLHLNQEEIKPNKKMLSFYCFLRYEGNNLKNKHVRVTVLVHDTSSECALQMYEVLLKHMYL